MEAKVDEIADRIFRISTFMPHVLPPAGLTFNQFLILADEPMLFHCGHRKQFSNVSAAVAKALPLDKLRWVSFGHFEADECGAMNEWLAVSPLAEVVHGVAAASRSTTWQTALHARFQVMTYWTWVAGVSGSSTRLMFRTDGTRASSSRRRLRHCSAVICSRMAAIARR